VAVIAVVVVAFGMTTLDSGTRLLRYNIEELAGFVKAPAALRRTGASLLAVAAIGFFGFKGGMPLLLVFGTTNQLLAGLTLLVVGAYLLALRRRSLPVTLPMGFMLIVTIWAMVVNLNRFFHQQEEKSWVVIIAAIAVLALAVWLCVEAVPAYRKALQRRGEAARG